MTRPANLHAVHACLADSSTTPFCLVGTIFPSSVPKRRGKPHSPGLRRPFSRQERAMVAKLEPGKGSPPMRHAKR